MSLFALAAMKPKSGGVVRPMRITVKQVASSDDPERLVATIVEHEDGAVEVLAARGVRVRSLDPGLLKGVYFGEADVT